MKGRQVAILALVGFMAYTGIYIFVYLWRSFRIDSPDGLNAVGIWHGDPFARAILVAVLFLMGLVVVLHVSLVRRQGGYGQIKLRRDLHEWLVEQADEMNEPPSHLADRAIASYRARLEGTRTT
jgi:hypothetical protein